MNYTKAEIDLIVVRNRMAIDLMKLSKTKCLSCGRPAVFYYDDVANTGPLCADPACAFKEFPMPHKLAKE